MKYLWFAAVAAVLACCAGAQTVIFSRSTDDSNAPAKSASAPPQAPATDAERQALTFLSYDLDVHLQPREHAMAVRAHIVLRNDSESPLNRLALQISSSLQWTGVRIADAPATFSQEQINSDIDHTGALREAVIPLATASRSAAEHCRRPHLRRNRRTFRYPPGTDRYPGGCGRGLRLGPGL